MISGKLGGYGYCPLQGFVVDRVYGGAFVYSNYKCYDSCKSSMRDINRFVSFFKEICGLLGKGMSFYGFKGEYWKYMERGIGISGIQFYTVLS